MRPRVVIPPSDAQLNSGKITKKNLKPLANPNKTPNFALNLYLTIQGKVLEWLKRQTWKVCNGRKPFAGSNPALSAEKDADCNNSRRLFCVSENGRRSRLTRFFAQSKLGALC